MAQHNYETGYPLNLEAGSTEKPLSAFQKVKAEFERIYRLFNSSLDYIDEMVERANQLMAEIRQELADFKTYMESIIEQIRQELQDTIDAVDTKIAGVTSVGSYYSISSSGTASTDGFIIVWFDNSGYVSGNLYIAGQHVGQWTGDGSYGGATVTGTFPIAKGQSWSWSGSGLQKLLFAPLGQ